MRGDRLTANRAGRPAGREQASRRPAPRRPALWRRALRRTARRAAGRLLALPVALLTLPLLSGCGVLPGSGGSVTVSHPVWMPDGWVYYLREVSSDGTELWRQRGEREAGDAGERVMAAEEIGRICDRAQLSFLYHVSGEEVGLAAECADGSRTELAAYSPRDGSVRPVASTPFLGGAVLTAGGTTGYVELPTACGGAIRPIQGGVVREFATPVTIAGTSWRLSGASPPDCGSTGWARSPALGPDGTLYFLAAPGSVGKLPVTDPDALDKFEWYLCSWDGRSAEARVITTLRGVADLTVSSDGRHVVAAVSAPRGGGISVVDATTGQAQEADRGRRAYHPSLSPDGRRYVYVDHLHTLRFGSLPT